MLDVHGSFSLPITTVTANYTVGANDYTVLCNNSVSITITLPTAVGISGRIIVIKKLTATSTTIDGYSSETIDGATTVVSTTQWLSWMLQATELPGLLFRLNNVSDTVHEDNILYIGSPYQTTTDPMMSASRE